MMTPKSLTAVAPPTNVLPEQTNLALIGFWRHSFFAKVIEAKGFSHRVAERIVDSVEKYNHYDIDESLFIALMWNESQFNPDNHSDNLDPITGEVISTDYGLFQLNSRTYSGMTPEQLLNMDTNVRLGELHLVGNLKDFSGNERRSLMAYNAGTARGFLPPDKTAAYAERILALKTQYDVDFDHFVNAQQSVAMRD